ncbi:GNAT family N-acetyltransferase [Streptomyces anandii]|uniref:GNAT family N-acetyltransferase n=1 Tax=Streptomyces anandii TaxID=285454 RepID=UPI0035712A0E
MEHPHLHRVRRPNLLPPLNPAHGPARVLPPCRRAGIGAAVYEKVLAHARALGAGVVETVVLAANQDDVRFAEVRLRRDRAVRAARRERPVDHPAEWAAGDVGCRRLWAGTTILPMFGN